MAAVLLRTLFDVRSDVWFRVQEHTKIGGEMVSCLSAFLSLLLPLLLCFSLARCCCGGDGGGKLVVAASVRCPGLLISAASG